ncbi:MAG: precorrin-8X methylmutase [Thermodesulfobacteriota bacterium]
MNVQLQQVKPEEIERESFRILEAELGPTTHSLEEFAVVRRVIHATGDFSFAESLRFHPAAMAAARQAILGGKNVLADVTMSATGISKGLLAKHGGQVLCGVGDPEVAAEAKAKGLTRSEMAIRKLAGANIGIVAIGNAPTALLEVMRLIEEGFFRPDLVVGVPVGFVNAAESKAILAEKTYPFITTLGRKGGSPVAAATVNALLRLVEEG